ncbi:MAG: hypothetical protein HZB83_05035 [Deltaproteobacteria bacterium]|nr:hypothetical protein [Deltaproteobacteria bacterium]
MTILTDVSADVKNVTETLSKVLGGKEGEATLRNILKNIEEVSYRVNRVVTANDERVASILRNFDEFSSNLKTNGPEIVTEFRQAIKGANEALVKTSDNINIMISENRGNLKDGIENLKLASVKLQEAMDSINNVTKKVTPEISDTMTSVSSIAKKIEKGEGTLGKLINDPSLHEGINKTISGINRYIDKSESFRTYLGYRGEYLVRAKDGKSYVTLRLQPKSDKYYLFEIVDDPRGKRRKETRTLRLPRRRPSSGTISSSASR